MAGRYREPFQPGDVVWGPDACHDDDPLLVGQAVRPWMILNNDKFPGQGSHHVVCGLTSDLGRSGSMRPLAPEDWERGGPPTRSQLDTETLFTMKQEWIVSYSGRLAHAQLAHARKVIKGYL